MADFKTVSDEIHTNIFLMKEILENIHIESKIQMIGGDFLLPQVL